MIVGNNLHAVAQDRVVETKGANGGIHAPAVDTVARSNGDAATQVSITASKNVKIRQESQREIRKQTHASKLQVASGAMKEVSGMLHRITELTVKAADKTTSASNRAEIQSEMEHILSQIEQISSGTTFDSKKVFEGKDYSTPYSLYGVGTDLVSPVEIEAEEPSVEQELIAMNRINLGLDAIDCTSSDGARAAGVASQEAERVVNSNISLLAQVQEKIGQPLAGYADKINDGSSFDMSMGRILERTNQVLQAQEVRDPQNVMQLLQ